MSGWSWEGTDYNYITMTIVTGNETFPENLTQEEPEEEQDQAVPPSAVGAVMLAIVLGIIAFITVVGNIMVMISFKMDKQLQTISNYFLFSLAVADFIIGAYSIPFFTIHFIMGKWPFSSALCDIWLSIDYMASNASVMNLLAISVDRYFSVTRPLSYRARRTTKKAALMILSAWGLSLVLWVPPIYAWPYIEGTSNLYIDPGGGPGSESCFIQFVETNQFMSILCAMMAFYIPVSIMCGLYVRVWWETVKRQRDLVHLQAGKKASSKRSDSSEEVEVVRKGEKEEQWNTQSNGTQRPPGGRINGRIRHLLRSCSSAEEPVGFVEDPSSEGYVTPHSIGTPHQPARSISGICERLETNSLTRHGTSHSCGVNGSNGQPAGWRQSYSSQRHSTSDLLEELKGCKVDSVYTILIQFPATSLNDTTADSTSIRMLSDSPQPEIHKSQPGLSKPHQLSTPSLPDWPTAREVRAQTPCQREARGRGRNNRSDSRDSISLNTRIVPKQYVRSVQSSAPPPAPVSASSLPRKNKLKKASQEKRQERKAAKTLSLILLVFLLTWTPYNVLAVMKGILGPKASEEFIPQLIWDISYCLCYINSTINPFCYALCNATFRKTYVRILSCKWGDSKKQPVNKYYYG